MLSRQMVTSPPFPPRTLPSSVLIFPPLDADSESSASLVSFPTVECNEGYTGPLCSVCAVGWGDFGGGVCLACPPLPPLAFALAALPPAVCIILGTIVALVTQVRFRQLPFLSPILHTSSFPPLPSLLSLPSSFLPPLHSLFHVPLHVFPFLCVLCPLAFPSPRQTCLPPSLTPSPLMLLHSQDTSSRSPLASAWLLSKRDVLFGQFRMLFDFLQVVCVCLCCE